MTDIIILRSDFYSDINPNNTQSKFTTNFDNPLDFSNGYEIGVVEIIFPTNVKNIPIDEYSRRIKIAFETKSKIHTVLKNSIILPTTNYKKFENLKNDINTAIQDSNNDLTKKENEDMLKLIYKDHVFELNLPQLGFKNDHFVCNNGSIIVKNKVKNEIVKEIKLFLIFPEFLNSMLGFEGKELKREKNKAKYQPDLYNNSHTLFIYCNIVQESFISNIKSQLLRIFPLEKFDDEKQMKSITFNPIIFRPLRVGVFDSINIEIRDSIGNLVIFESGCITLTLMLRKI